MVAQYASDYKLRDELIIVAICEQMGWTYEQYIDQPEWFIWAIIKKNEIDAKRANKPQQNNI